MSTAVFFRQYDLPWTPGDESEQRFRRILRNAFLGYAVLAVVIPFLPLVEKEPSRQPDLPERVVKLVLEQPKPVPPPPVVQPKPEPEPLQAEERPKPVERPREARPVEPEERKVAAREKALAAGLLPFVDELADLRDNRSVASLGSNRPLTGAVGDGPRTERSLITSKAGRGSGGINTAALSRNTGGGGLGGRGTTQVTSTLGGGEAVAAAESAGPGGRPARSREEIEMVFDQNKGAIYALYSRALRRDPTLQGKLVLSLTIEPNGAVSACEVVSSELADDELLQKLVARVKMFRFTDKDVATVTTTKPIDFFPA